jgi:hypothetical protein
MVYFQTQNPNLGQFRRVLVYLVAFRRIFPPFGKFYGHLISLVVIWYILPVLVCCTKKNLATLLCVQAAHPQALSPFFSAAQSPQKPVQKDLIGPS